MAAFEGHLRRERARPLEAHALVHDGIVDRGFASGVLSGIGSTYTTALRVREAVTTGGTGCLWQVLPSTGTVAACIADHALRKATSGVYWAGFQTTGAVAWGNVTDPASQVTGEPKVLAIKRDGTSNAKTRIARATGLEFTRDFAVAGVFVTPHSLAVGYRLNADGTTSTQPCPVAWTGLVAVVGEATDDELVRYAQGEDPRSIWGASLWCWYAPSLAYYDGSDWRVPNLGSAGGTMLLSGPTRSDLAAVPS